MIDVKVTIEEIQPDGLKMKIEDIIVDSYKEAWEIQKSIRMILDNKLNNKLKSV